MPDCLPPLGIEDIDHKYEILAKMGEGGMGEIFRVRHTLLDEVRVIKTIRSDFRGNKDLQDRFLREARVATQLRHRNIAAIYDFSVGEDGTACIVMEFIDGRTLLERTESGHRHSLAEVVEIGCQTLEALDYLHGHKVVHRDISPDNIMWATDHRGATRIKLIDMGIAKPLDSSVIKTATSMFIGKVRYASPEQLRTGAIGLDGGSDLYSLGVVLYELLTGELAVTGSDQASLIAGHLFHAPRSFDETDPGHLIPEPVRQVLLCSLAKERGERYDDAPAFAAALREAYERSLAQGAEPTMLRPEGAGSAAQGGDTVAHGEGGAPTRLASPDGVLQGTSDVRPTVARPGVARPGVTRPGGSGGPEAETVPMGSAGLDATKLRADVPPTLLSGEQKGGLDPTSLNEAHSGKKGEEAAETALRSDQGPPPTVLTGSEAADSSSNLAGSPTQPSPFADGVRSDGRTAGPAYADPSLARSGAPPTGFPDAGSYAGPVGRDLHTRRRSSPLQYAAAAIAVLAVAAALWWGLGRTGDPTAPDGPTITDTERSGEEALALSAADLAALNFGTYRALVIGNDDYASLPPLETAVRDAQDVARILEEKYGFEVTLLTNANRYELVTAVSELANSAQPGDNLLLYYAGHGDLERRNETAYWHPVDADPFDTSNWVPIKYDVSRQLDQSMARRVLVIADSCYSGTTGETGGAVVETPAPNATPREVLEQQLGLRARLAFTSGSLEPVLDTVGGKHSVFADALLAALDGQSGLLDVPTLYSQVRGEVEREAAEQGIRQLPDLAPIPLSDHEGGNFFFLPTADRATG